MKMKPIEVPKLRILVIEDNQDIAENIADFLEPKGHQLDFAMDGIGGLHLALNEVFDVIVLDLMLPGMDGITLCRKLRREAQRTTPVLMLTARDTLPDKLEGFQAGTDDYLVKPFALEELEVRLLALVKRGLPSPLAILKVSDLEVDTGSMTVMRAGRPVELNKTCLKILIKLLKASPNVVSRQEIEFKLWGDNPPGSDALRSHIYTLRRRIDAPFETPLIETVHGIGFRIGNQNESS
jgi:DNA-binding response OmpR family regulator